METWQLESLEVEPHHPKILSSTDEARTILIRLPEGEKLEDHQVHERALLVVVAGEVEVTADGGQRAAGGPGLTIDFAPGERHEVLARSEARLLLVLTPWPGDGHPGAMTLEEKAGARERAAERNA
jgi:quercetin dioxygenase-like cupin family protein